jgi:hypothetical protein
VAVSVWTILLFVWHHRSIKRHVTETLAAHHEDLKQHITDTFSAAASDPSGQAIPPHMGDPIGH